MKQSYRGKSSILDGTTPTSMLIDGLFSRTVSQHHNGLSAGEVKRLNGLLHFLDGLRRQYRHKIFYAVLGDELLAMNPADARTVVSKFTSRLVELQSRASLPQFWVLVWESSKALHANIVFIGNENLAGKLERGFAHCMQGDKAMQLVAEIDRLCRYLWKESTPQCSFALAHAGTRAKGSHKIADGGDRVRCSPALRMAAISSGAISDWQRTNAKINPETMPRKKRLKPPAKNLRLSGQIELFPEIDRPAVRLGIFQGGILTATQALELEFKRHRAGLTQQSLCDRAGVSQPTLANALARRFGLSRQTAFRIRAVLAA